MNRKQAKELLPIIQAYINGWEIEILDVATKKWRVLTDPKFNCNIENYRIKPEPRVIYVDKETNKIVGPHGAARWQVTKFIEVLEDE